MLLYIVIVNAVTEYNLILWILFRSENDPWDWLAKLMNIFEALDDKSIEFESEMKEGKDKILLVSSTYTFISI